MSKVIVCFLMSILGVFPTWAQQNSDENFGPFVKMDETNQEILNSTAICKITFGSNPVNSPYSVNLQGWDGASCTNVGHSRTLNVTQSFTPAANTTYALSGSGLVAYMQNSYGLGSADSFIGFQCSDGGGIALQLATNCISLNCGSGDCSYSSGTVATITLSPVLP